MHPAEISTFLSRLPDPAGAALRWWETTPAPRAESSDVLRRVLQSVSHLKDPALARALVQAGQNWGETEPSRAAELSVALASAGTPAAQCLAAALVERAEPRKAAEGYARLAYSQQGEARALVLLQAVKAAVRAKELGQAAVWARDAAKEAASLRTVTALDSAVQKLGRESPLPARRNCRIALVGTVTMDLLIPVLRMACFSRGINAEIWTGGFGQHAQEILGVDSALARWQPEIVAIFVDHRSVGLSENSPNPEAWIDATARELAALWKACGERLKAHVIQFGFETVAPSAFGQFSAVAEGGSTRVLRWLNERLRSLQAGAAGVSIFDLDRVAAEVGAAAWRNETLWLAAKQYPAPEALVPLANRLAAQIQATLGLAAKCLVLDLDGTLWGGVVGEDGPDRIVLGAGGAGEAYANLQRYVKNLRERGILLAVCSKNNEADAKEPFRSNPEMVLRLEDIAVFVANWEAKDENLRQIAKTLNLGLDALVFADDNPVECRWVAERLPEVDVIELSGDPAGFIAEIDRRQPFEILRLSAEDRVRADAQTQENRRIEVRAAAGSVDEFVAGLAIQVRFEPLAAANVGRVAQLINKTNQFNLTTRRTTEAEVASLIGNPAHLVQLVRVSDRYGEYGLTGVLIARREGSELMIETWLMSCRVLGRKVEQTMMAELVRAARAEGVTRLIGHYVPSGRNAIVQELYPSFGFVIAAANNSYAFDLAGSLPETPQGILVLR